MAPLAAMAPHVTTCSLENMGPLLQHGHLASHPVSRVAGVTITCPAPQEAPRAQGLGCGFTHGSLLCAWNPSPPVQAHVATWLDTSWVQVAVGGASPVLAQAPGCVSQVGHKQSCRPREARGSHLL